MGLELSDSVESFLDAKNNSEFVVISAGMWLQDQSSLPNSSAEQIAQKQKPKSDQCPPEKKNIMDRKDWLSKIIWGGRSLGCNP